MRASRESVAYKEYGGYELPSTGSQQQQEKKAKLHVVNGHRRGLSLSFVMTVFTVAAVAVAIIYNYMSLTVLTDKVSRQRTELAELESEYTYLKTQREMKLNLGYVESYAQTSLNMMKMDKNQAEYVELSNPDLVVVAESGSGLGQVISNLVKSFSAIMEYIQ